MSWKKSLEIWPTQVKSVNDWGGNLGNLEKSDHLVKAAGVDVTSEGKGK